MLPPHSVEAPSAEGPQVGPKVETGAREDPDRPAAGTPGVSFAAGLGAIPERALLFLERSLRLERRLLDALISPAACALGAALSLGWVLTCVVPPFERMYDETGIPRALMTEVLLATSRFVRAWWLLILLSPLAALLGLRALASRPRGRYLLDRATPFLPVVGPIFSKSREASFCRTLGAPLAAGLSLPEALKRARGATSSEWLARTLDGLQESVRAGQSLAGALGAAGGFDPALVRTIEAGEEAGELAWTLARLGETRAGEAELALEALVGLFKTLLILGTCAALAFVAVALFLPVIGLQERL